MLLSFSVTDYRSFRDEQTLNLLASKRLGATKGPAHCCEIPGTEEHVLRVASLYGANGAGKSNLVRAIALLKRLVLRGTSPGEPLPSQPFVLDERSAAEPTTFELQFLQDGEVFRYGLCYDDKRVHEEWLSVYEGKKELSLFTRHTTEDGSVTVELGPAAKGMKKVESLAEVGARPNQLFLNEIVNLGNRDAQGPRLARAIGWFLSTLTIIEPKQPLRSAVLRKILAEETFAEFAARFLREASTGIAGLEVKTDEIPSSAVATRTSLQRFFFESPRQRWRVVRARDDKDVFLEQTATGTVKRRTIKALHGNGKEQPKQLPLREESDGSQRLLNLLPALHHLTTQGGVFVIDELERSMHPMLARKFIEFFLKSAPGTRSQLIFATHESTLLDLDLVRRDGIWFAEKDAEEATHLYSLADFKVRNDLRIEKGYLAGRFGAIPFLGGIDRLMEEQAAAGAGE